MKTRELLKKTLHVVFIALLGIVCPSCEEENPFEKTEGTGGEPLEIETLDILADIEKDEMVYVKGGSYNMGATDEQGSEAKADETPVHLVMLSDYHISRYEVTQKFWETIMGDNPSSEKGYNLPVDNVSWEECQQFIKLLNQRTGKNFSLPTEAEWEYAARGGKNQTATKYSGSNTASEVAWSDAIDGTIQPVGTKKYNALGIYDMSGNVSEWCYDWYGAYTDQDQRNPIGLEEGTKRVLRGGNISSATTYCRVSTRTSSAPDGKQAKTGFRLVLSKPCYAVSVTTTSEETGTVTINNSTKEQYIKEGYKVTLIATPKENCNFHNWTVNGEEVSKENPYTATITSNTEFVANFRTHKVGVTLGEGGTVEISKTQVQDNEEVTLTATPNEGYSFVNWTVNGVEVSKENPYTTKITEDVEYKANFISHKVTVISGEGGTAKSNKTQVGHNGQVTLTAIPNKSTFVNWTVNGKEVSKSNPYIATITSDTEFKANFDNNKYRGHECVDLGLPSGLKWATCNVGATAPEEYGDYFAWGEIKPKQTYYKSNYKYYEDISYYPTFYTYYVPTKYYIKYNHINGIVYREGRTVLERSDDAANANWGGDWRMPTKEQQEELRNNCTWTWTTQNGVKGYKVTSKKNGNSIFLPAAGYRNGSDLYDAGWYGYYWSSSLNTDTDYLAHALLIKSELVGWENNRTEGLSVRPVL